MGSFNQIKEEIFQQDSDEDNEIILVKVIMHKPDHYLLITNRKITSDFSDWIDNQVFSNTDYFIPFKVHLIQKEQLEVILSTPQYRIIMQKYFD